MSSSVVDVRVRFTVYRPLIASFLTPVLGATLHRQRLGLLVQVVHVPLFVVDLDSVFCLLPLLLVPVLIVVRPLCHLHLSVDLSDLVLVVAWVRFTTCRPHIASFPTPVLRAPILRQRLGLLVLVVNVPLVVVDFGPVRRHLHLHLSPIPLDLCPRSCAGPCTRSGSLVIVFSMTRSLRLSLESPLAPRAASSRFST